MDFAQRTSIWLDRTSSRVFSKDWPQRRLPMHYDPRDEAVEVYRFWRERNGGQRRVAGV